MTTMELLRKARDARIALLSADSAQKKALELIEAMK